MNKPGANTVLEAQDSYEQNPGVSVDGSPSTAPIVQNDGIPRTEGDMIMMMGSSAETTAVQEWKKRQEQDVFNAFKNISTDASDDERGMVSNDLSKKFFGVDSRDGAIWNNGQPLDGTKYYEKIHGVLQNGFSSLDDEETKAWRAIPSDETGRAQKLKLASEIYGSASGENETSFAFNPGGYAPAVMQSRKLTPEEIKANEDSLISKHQSELYARNYMSIFMAMKPTMSDRAVEIVNNAMKDGNGIVKDDIERFRMLSDDDASKVAFLTNAARQTAHDNFAMYGVRQAGSIIKSTLWDAPGELGAKARFEYEGVSDEVYNAYRKRELLLDSTNAYKPFAGYNYTERLVGNLMGTIAYGAIAAVPYVGVAAVAMQENQQIANRIIAEGGNPDDVAIQTAAASLAYAFTEKLQFGMVFGRGASQITKKALMESLTISLSEKIGKIGIGVVKEAIVNGTTETLEEGIQQSFEEWAVANGLGKDTSKAAIEGFKSQWTADTFGMMVAMSTFGSGKALVQARNAPKFQEALSDYATLKMRIMSTIGNDEMDDSSKKRLISDISGDVTLVMENGQQISIEDAGKLADRYGTTVDQIIQISELVSSNDRVKQYANEHKNAIKELQDMGISDKNIEAFIADTFFTPTDKLNAGQDNSGDLNIHETLKRINGGIGVSEVAEDGSFTVDVPITTADGKPVIRRYTINEKTGGTDTSSEGFIASIKDALSISGEAFDENAYRAMTPEEQVVFLTSKNLVEKGSFVPSHRNVEVKDEDGNTVTSDGLIQIINATEGITQKTDNAALVHEHTHAVLEMARREGAITPEIEQVLVEAFGAGVKEGEAFNEEAMANAMIDYIANLNNGVKEESAFLKNNPKMKAFFDYIIGFIKRVLGTTGQTVGVTETESQKARKTAFEAVRTGDFRGLSVYSGVKFTSKNATPVTESQETATGSVLESEAEVVAGAQKVATDPVSYAQNTPVPTKVIATVKNADGTKDFQTEYVWVSLDDLIDSTNFNHPKALAPDKNNDWNTTRSAKKLLESFNPMDLTESDTFKGGTPIIGGGLVIVAGSDRKLALDGLVEGGTFDASYLNPVNVWAESKGIPKSPAGMKNPVLTRRIVEAESEQAINDVATESAPEVVEVQEPVNIVKDSGKTPILAILDELKKHRDITYLPTNEILINPVGYVQAKGDADVKSGVVKGQTLSGAVNKLSLKPIIVIQRLDGTLVISTGRHRLDLYKRMGEATIPAIVLYEKDGWTKEMSYLVDAIDNIQDEKGTIRDYMRFLSNIKPSENDVRKLGLTSRPKGASAWSLYRNASQDLLNAIDWDKSRDNSISPEQAIAICNACPINDNENAATVQRVAMKAVIEGKNKSLQRPKVLEYYVRAMVQNASNFVSNKSGGGYTQASIFDEVEDTSWETISELQGKYVADKITSLSELRATINNALNKHESLQLTKDMAKELGITSPKNFVQIKAAVEKVKMDIARWESPALSRTQLDEVNAAIAPELKALGISEEKIQDVQARYSVVQTTEQLEYQVVEDDFKFSDKWLKAPNGNISNLSERQWVQVRTPSFKAWFGDWENDPSNASKVLDENGEPLVVYHGTADKIESFRHSNLGRTTGAASAKQAFFFSKDDKVSSGYADYARPKKIDNLKKTYERLERIAQIIGGNEAWDKYSRAYERYETAELEYSNNVDGIRDELTNIMGVFIDIKKPQLKDFEGEKYRDESYNDIISEAKKAKNDGVILKNTYDGMDEFAERNQMTDIFAVFNPKKIKSATDNSGAFNPDTNKIRFNLGTSTEVVKDLVAVHNLNTKKLRMALDIGGFPMPSIAVVKAENGHDSYGDISMIFGRDTVDPNSNRFNRVYSSDAWSPVVPRLYFKLDSKKIDKILKQAFKLERADDGDKLFHDNFKSYDFYSENLAKDFSDNFYDDGGMLDHAKTEKSYILFFAKLHNRMGDIVLEDGRINLPETVEKLGSDFDKWVEETFGDLVLKKGIRNDTDMFTPIGNQRSFNQLHIDNTLENIVKAMRKKHPASEAKYLSTETLRGLIANSFSSIEEMKKASKNLKKISEKEYDNIVDKIGDRLYGIVDSIKKDMGKTESKFSLDDRLLDALKELHGNITATGIQRIFDREYKQTIPIQILQDLMSLMQELKDVPVKLFEAKPRRAVYFTEVKAVIAPEDTPADIMASLKKKHLNIITYDGTNDDRLSKLNGLSDDIRFNVSVTPEQDKAYMDAVGRGDTDTAQKMVDEAANKAGWNTHKFYHGTTDATFTEFKKLGSIYKDSEDAFVFTDSQKVSDEFRGGLWVNENGDSVKKYPSNSGIYSVYLNIPPSNVSDWDWGGNAYNPDEVNSAIENAKKAGESAVVFRNMRDGNITTTGRWPMSNIVFVFNANQIKSADPMTYDDSGNIVPLSERFNERSNDIRFSVLKNQEPETREQFDEKQKKLNRARSMIVQMKNGRSRVEDAIVAFTTLDILSKKTPSVDAIRRTLKAVGKDESMAEQIIKSATKRAGQLLDKNDNRARTKDKTLWNAIVKMEMEDRYRNQTVESFVEGITAGIKGAKAATTIESGKNKIERKQIDDVVGYTAKRFQIDLGFDIVGFIMQMPDEIKAKLEKELPEKAKVIVQEAQDEEDVPEDKEPSEAMKARQARAKMLFNALQETAVQRESERTAKNAERKAKMDAKKQSVVSDIFDEQETFSDAEVEQDVVSEIEFTEKEMELFLPVFTDANEFTAFLIEYVGYRIREDNPEIDSTDEKAFWKNAVVLRELQKTAQHILRKMAKETLGKTIARGKAETAISLLVRDNSLSKTRKAITSAFSRLHASALSISRKKLIADVEKDIETLIKYNGRFATTKNDLERAVTASVEEWARYVRNVLSLSEAKVESGIEELDAIIENSNNRSFKDKGNNVISGVIFMRDKIEDAIEKRIILKKYGGLVHKMPGEIYDMSAEIMEQLNGAKAEHDRRKLENKKQNEEISAPILEAIDSLDVDLEPEPNWVERAIDSVVGIFSIRLEDLLRGIKDGVLRDKALEAFAMIKDMVSSSDEITRLYEADCTRQINELLVSCYGSSREAIKHFDEKIPEEFSRIISNQKISMTYGQVLQLYAECLQEAYADNVVKHGRDKQMDAMREVLTASDMKFHLLAVKFLSERREVLSLHHERVTGVPISQTDEMYFPARMLIGKTEGAQEVHQVWSPISSIFKARVEHGLDFNEKANILDVLMDNVSESARVIGFGESGLRLFGILSSKEIQNAIISKRGSVYNKRLQEHLTAIIGGGDRHDDSGFLVSLLIARRWQARASLFYNLPSGMKQIPGLFSFGYKQPILKYLLHIDMNAVRELKDSAGFKSRYTLGWSEETMNVLAQKHSGKIAKMLDHGMIFSRFFDQVVSLWWGQGYYRSLIEKFLASGMSLEEAKEKAATRTFAYVEETQQSGRTQNLNSFQRKNVLSGPLLQFTTAPLQQGQFEIQAFRNFKAGTVGAGKELAKVLIINHLLIPAGFALLNVLSDAILGKEFTDEEKKKKLKLLLISSLMGTWSAFPIIGVTIESAFKRLMGIYQYGGIRIAPAEGMLDVSKNALVSSVKSSGWALNKMGIDDFDISDEEILKDWDRVLKGVSLYRNIKEVKENYGE